MITFTSKDKDIFNKNYPVKSVFYFNDKTGKDILKVDSIHSLKMNFFDIYEIYMKAFGNDNNNNELFQVYCILKENYEKFKTDYNKLITKSKKIYENPNIKEYEMNYIFITSIRNKKKNDIVEFWLIFITKLINNENKIKANEDIKKIKEKLSKLKSEKCSYNNDYINFNMNIIDKIQNNIIDKNFFDNNFNDVLIVKECYNNLISTKNMNLESNERNSINSLLNIQTKSSYNNNLINTSQKIIEIPLKLNYENFIYEFNNSIKSLKKKDILQSSNLVYSPYSIFMIMNLVKNGTGGSVLKEISKIFKFDDNQMKLFREYIGKHVNEKVFIIKDSSSLLFNKSDFNENFISIINNLYGNWKNYLIEKPFTEEGLMKINDSLSKETSGYLNEIIKSSISKGSNMFIVNLINFEDKWVNDFHKSGKEKFNLFGNKSKIDVEMMKISEGYEKYGKHYFDNGISFESINIKYKNGLSAILILPNGENTIDNFNKIEKMVLMELSKSTDWITKNQKLENINIKIPIFSIEKSEIDVKDTLMNMGILQIFELSNDFYRMFNKNFEVKVENIKQKAYIKMNEIGTVAGAVTVMDFRCMAAPPSDVKIKTIDIVFDRPFFGFITHNNTIIFIFNVINPLIK